ncbi:(2Fe-2S)-binding protein [Brevibacillus humidisoli]|uniref:(2Fe-2S)-binding protein n=1 Tax=Brevibacillus humidisoli TaxID=2895522 RepID=UPI001E500CFE|nr:(2Fe-2S)-binding protein [Brevibacillus humidisoli]UFJ42446.1 (2Fe-2S)-binding protein [Brevibacillus humidisoli]
MQSYVPIEMVLNGSRVPCTVEADQTLVDFLRQQRGLTGTHIGCDTVSCGACTVLLDGRAVKSCSVLAVQCDQREVLTVEGLRDDDFPMLRQAFQECFAIQCGFCTPGFLLTSAELIRAGKPMDRKQIAEQLTGNYCRCTGYQPILNAIEQVLHRLDGEQR